MSQDVRQFGEVLETDVLIVGGGLAGSNAAIGAAETGARVLIADKSAIERCGDTAGGVDHFMAYLGSGEPWDTREGYLECRQGHLPLDLTGQDKPMSGQILPEFFNKAGERIEIPGVLSDVLKAAVCGANCVGCTHQHYTTAPKVPVTPPIVLPDRKHGVDEANTISPATVDVLG